MSVTPLNPRGPAIVGRRPVLVTGGAGFIGSNLADRLARDGHDVLVYDALARPGVEINVAWLRKRHPQRVSIVTGDIRDDDAISAAATEAQAVFHFAAQVAVTTSLVNPREDFAVNVQGTLNLLEALRRRAEPVPLLFASTNKVYGDLADIALDETNDAYLPSGREHPRPRRRRGPPARFPHTLWLLQGRGGSVRPRLCPLLRRAHRRDAHELHLRPAPARHRGPGLGGAFPHPRAPG